MELLGIVKLRLRLKTTTFDDDVEDLIEEARADMKLVGIKEEKAQDDTDPLIRQAVSLFCRARFGENPKAEQYMQAYERLRDKLSLAGEYSGRME